MPLDKDEKEAIKDSFGLHDKDTGSEAVQIAMLTKRIKTLADHFEKHKKDHHSRRGLIAMVSRRRKLLKYMKRHNFEGHTKLISELGIRK